MELANLALPVDLCVAKLFVAQHISYEMECSVLKYWWVTV